MNIKSNLLGRFCRHTEDSADLFIIQSVFLDLSDRVAVLLERADKFGNPLGGRLTTTWANDIILEPARRV